MNIESFFDHYKIEQNPFDAEEARLDPIFDRLKQNRLTHPDFSKILGNPEQAGTAIVFGEKGSGKTAIRILLGRRIREHNEAHPERRVLVVDYDDLNPVLDKLLRHRKQKEANVLKKFRLEDHQDAILSRAVTKLVSSLLDEDNATDESAPPAPIEGSAKQAIRKLSKENRTDLAVLAALYDQPRSGSATDRWSRLKSKLRLGLGLTNKVVMFFAGVASIIAVALVVAWLILRGGQYDQMWLQPVMWVMIVVAVVLWVYWGVRSVSLWNHCRRICHEMPVVDRSPGDLRQMLGELSMKTLGRQPFPTAGRTGKSDDNGNNAGDARYQLTRRLVDLLHPFGYVAIIVLVDRVDEPTLVSGDAEKMKSLIWPMFDNKFLQQQGVGLKLLLPIELRHMLHRESPQFYQEARMDKQNMIDRLSWSGATLYDLCSMRLRACRPDDAGEIALTDLFQEDVDRETLVDALDQMHQPRDAFKFLYQVIQEHCRLVPEDEADYDIARLTLESVRKQQSQRVQEFYRGLTPA